MASADLTAAGKARARKDGAAIPLDEFDKRLLDAMQGSFPIAERPYAAVADALGVQEDDVLRRVRELIEARIIRQVTPIYDTRAFGYGSMLVPARWSSSFCTGTPRRASPRSAR